MRPSAKSIALSMTALALSFGLVSCSSSAPQPVVETHSQEQLLKRNAAEAQKVLDGFFTSIASETAALKKPEGAAENKTGESGTAEEVASANLNRVKQGYPQTYGYLDETALGAAGTVKVIALYANPVAITPGISYQSSEKDLKVDGDTATVMGNSINVKVPEGTSNDFRAGNITLTFKDGKWLITDFSMTPADVSIVS